MECENVVLFSYKAKMAFTLTLERSSLLVYVANTSVIGV